MTEAEILDYLGNLPDNDVHLPMLVRQMKTGNGIVPFVGAGMSARFGFPEWGAFLRDLAKRAGITDQIEDHIRAGRYEEAAEDLVQELKPPEFQNLMQHYFGDQVLQGKHLDGAAALVPQISNGPVITTNFDRVLEKAFQDADCPFGMTVWHSKVSLAIPAFAENQSVLLKLHGDWQDPDGRVLTLTEYKQNYGDPDGDLDLNLPLPQILLLLAIRPVLFLGCSLQQDRTVAILKRVAGKFASNRHYAVCQKSANEVEHRQRADYLQSLHIVTIWYAAGEHAKLEGLLRYLSEQLPAPLRRRPATAPAQEDTIPRPLTAFVGREAEGKELVEKLKDNRLLTITGAPGSGKTRLAIELARAVRPDFDGVWFVELSQLQDKNLVPQRVATVCGIREPDVRPPTEVLKDFLKTGKHLVVLDNCEHLAEACASLARYLLQHCALLQIVATSRKILNAGESVYSIPPLALPDPKHLPGLQELERIDSVKLLRDRARLHFDFKITEENAVAVATLCRGLEGIPLALELAAAQLKPLGVDEILANLNQRLELLTGGTGGTEDRQWATLTEALNLSYGLLDAEQAVLFRRLSIFHHGWTRKAAAICQDPGQTEFTMLALLNQLDGMSLVVVEDVAGGKRFRLLDFVREYARDKLREAGEEPALAERHAHWHMELAEKGNPELLKKDQAKWLNALAAEGDNFRAAIDWAIASGQTEMALRLVGSLWRLMEIRGYYREGNQRLKAALAMPEAGKYPARRAKLLSGLGMFAYRQGEMDAAEKYFTEDLEIERAEKDPAGIANALNDLGNVAQMKGDYAAARHRYDECLAIQRQRGDIREIAVAVFNLGNAARRLGLEEEAGRSLEEARSSFEGEGNLREAAFALNSLGLLALARGELEVAVERAEKSLQYRQDLGDKKGVGETKRTLAAIRLRQGDLAKSAELLVEGAELARGVDDKRGIAEGFDLFGALAVAQKEFVRAVSLYAAAEKLRSQIQIQLAPVERAGRDANLDRARAALSEADFAKAWASDPPMTIAAAVAGR